MTGGSSVFDVASLVKRPKNEDVRESDIDKAAAKVGNGKIALLGGIGINTPGTGIPDYFLPLKFEVRHRYNMIETQLL